jgi:hypothetical protein
VSYNLVFSHLSPSSNQPILCLPLLTTPTLAIEIQNNHQRNPNWKHAGYVQATYVASDGVVSGRSIPVIFGRTELRLEIPGYPYQLRFSPGDWIYAWELKLYEKSISGAEGTPSVPLTTAENTANGWVIWT